jgi:hypothetical protein
MTKQRLVGWLLVAAMGGALAASAAPAPIFRAGADLRLREEYFDNIPIKADPPGVTRGGENNYFRIRPRVWAELDAWPGVITLRARAVNETRIWLQPDMSLAPQRSTYEFMDEIVFDHLYIDAKLGKKASVRVGRQDLIYGTGKVILEGTPKDGSRTIYFTAAKATLDVIPDTSVDLVALYNPYHDELVIEDSDRDLTGFTKNNDKMDESGAFVYAKNKSAEKLPFEVYAIYKNEESYATSPTTAVHSLDLGTVGFRLMPKFTDRIGGNLEVAYQLGSRGAADVGAYMVDAFANFTVIPDLKAVADAGLYVLSGNDPGTADDEGWDPLWARYPQYSEIYVYGYDADAAGRWSNVLMPHAGFTITPAKWVKASTMLAALWAPEDDGPGDGNYRGTLGVVKGEFTMGEKMLLPKDKLTGHLWLELFNPGDYYRVNDLAVFGRWEVLYAF